MATRSSGNAAAVFQSLTGIGGLTGARLKNNVRAELLSGERYQTGPTDLGSGVPLFDGNFANPVDGDIRYSLLDNPLMHLPFTPNETIRVLNGNLLATRNSGAAYRDIYGVIRTAAINELRIEKEGALTEVTSSNVIQWSEDFSNGVWQPAFGSFSPSAANQPSPDDLNTAQIITLGSTTNIIRQTLSAVTGSSFSSWIKIISGSFTNIEIDHGDGDAVNVLPQITATGQWFRVEAPNLTKGVSPHIDILMQCQPNDTISIWGAQLEELPKVTSYIHTTSAPATRASDVLAVGYQNNFIEEATTVYNDSEGVQQSLTITPSATVDLASMITGSHISDLRSYLVELNTSELKFINGK